MLTSCDAETGVEVVENGESERLHSEWYPVRANEAEHGHANDKECVEPVDMLVPVAPCDGELGDVWLPRVELLVGVSKGNVVGGTIGEGLSLHCDRRRDRRR